ncbi:bone morphogenetic protein 7-like isoform X1 [Argiope bruennichi]|uniref:bone morphogenetic protein 7-like isoform X1 n=1 Tax=Argiope bruennichi TaxID=94029 RepID=UPI002494A793|nr:bone morphogenetic protein 7-like isoform X1 [Argiope bruennichi]
MIFLSLTCFCLMLTTSWSTTSNGAPENSLPEALRQSPSSLVRILNISSAADLQVEALVNASYTLSNTSLADIESDNLTHALQLQYRKRKRQERLTVIRNQILSSLHMNREPNISAPSTIFSEDEQMRISMFMERLQYHNSQADSLPAGNVHFNTIQWLQSFYPSCSVPNNTDKVSWEQPGTFRILYDVPFNKYSTNITIMTAKLRLYKITGNVDPNYVGFASNRPRYNLLESLMNVRAANSINVNIYQYSKPLRTNKREKKRLVDSRTISVDFKGWVEFNVITSLNFWYRHSSKNYGLDVEVEDAFGNKLNPNLYFQNMNCSSEVPARDPPFPNIMEMHREIGKNESSIFDNETYPTLDLRTAELPRDLGEFESLEESLKERVVRKRSTENTCRKELEYVSFADVGLDEYILWPQGVLWTFCDGGCGPKVNTPQNREYFFSSWFTRLFKLKRKAPGSDCTVTRRESLPVILYDGETQLLETVLEDFVPVDCGCRAS